MDFQKAYDGIYDRLVNTSNTFRSMIEVSGTYKLYYQQADQTVTLPFVVITFLPISHSYDTHSKLHDGIVQFLIACDTPEECNRISKALSDRLSDSETSVTMSPLSLRMLNNNLSIPPQKIDKVYNSYEQYKFLIQG